MAAIVTASVASTLVRTSIAASEAQSFSSLLSDGATLLTVLIVFLNNFELGGEDGPRGHSKEETADIEDHVGFICFQSRTDVRANEAHEGLAEKVDTEGHLQVALELEPTDALGKHVHSTVLEAPGQIHEEGEPKAEVVGADVPDRHSECNYNLDDIGDQSFTGAQSVLNLTID